MTDLSDCLAFTLSYEGLFSDNPRDPGGATNYGITLATFRTVMKNARLGVLQLRALTKAQAEGIYLRDYYLPARSDQVPPGASLMVGDFAVNAGVRQSVMLLQATVKATRDGVPGPETIALAQAMQPRALVDALGVAQEAFYRGCKGFSVFGDGWLTRVDARTTAALNMAG